MGVANVYDWEGNWSVAPVELGPQDEYESQYSFRVDTSTEHFEVPDSMLLGLEAARELVQTLTLSIVEYILPERERKMKHRDMAELVDIKNHISNKECLEYCDCQDIFKELTRQLGGNK